MRLGSLDWKNSIYSDGSGHYISNPNPRLGETVTVRLRMFSHAPAKAVFLRCVINGSHRDIPMEKAEASGLFLYYKCDMKMSQKEINYHFLIADRRNIYYYNQLEVIDYPPTEDHDFRILADYESPEWVKSAVFYQIFPDRFHNGDPENDVRDNEYTFDGHPTVKKAWGEKVPEYSEAFCLDFFGGDLEGIRQKIPYLKELGVNALYLTPIFKAATHHRYDCMDYFSVDPHLGGEGALQELVEALHENDMKIIVDVSINHTGTANKWFNRDGFYPETAGAYNNPGAEEREYYYFGEDNDYHKWFGVETLPTLNYTSQKLREVIYRSEDSVVRKWLKPPYSIDGWRFDVGFCTARLDERQMHHEIWPEIRKSIKAVNPEAYILAEHWADCREFLRGDEWDASMNYFGFGRLVRQFAGEPDRFVEGLAGRGPGSPARRRAGELARMFMQHLARLPYQIASLQYNLYDSHDMARLHNNPEIPYESRRAAIIMQFTFPGAPGVYYGDEISLDGHIRTAEGCRYAMEWEPEKQDGETLRLHKTLARLKRGEEALRSGGFKILYAKGYVIAYARFTDEKAFIVVCSQDKSARKVKIPAGLAGVSGDSQVKEIFGREAVHSIENGVLSLELKPRESLLLEVKL